MNRWILTIPTIVLFASAVSFAQEPLPPSYSVAQPPPDDTLRVQPLAGSATMASMGTAFTYQGQLRKSGAPVNGLCDFQFSLHSAASGGIQIGPTQTKSNIQVTNGLFTIPDLDFGSGAFNGEARWLAIAVQCPGDSGYTALSPRQALTPAPYALALPGLWTQQNSTSPNLIGGYHGNQVTAGAVGATIGGGGDTSAPNVVADHYGTVGGGAGNRAGNSNHPFATVGGGFRNTATGISTTVGGGHMNSASGDAAAIGGGYMNSASGIAAAISGGRQNRATGNYATVSGGQWNIASGFHATVSGGYSNTVSGHFATIGGGYQNIAAGNYSVVFGYRAKNSNANHRGVFLFADSSDFDFYSTGANQFLVRATGGVTFVLGISTLIGNPTWTCSVVNGGTWACSSDRSLKANLARVDSRQVLAQLSGLPIYTWSVKGGDPTVRHIGPTAQDFYAAFGFGRDDKTISTIDLDGVALAAIQGLHQENKALNAKVATVKAKLATLEAENAALKAEVAALSARLAAIEQALRAQGEVKP
jgi:hypothetical protein